MSRRSRLLVGSNLSGSLWRFSCLTHIAVFSLLSASGCGGASSPASPSQTADQIFVGKVLSVAHEKLSRHELTNAESLSSHHREFGLQVKQISSSGVDSRLVETALLWANASIEFGNVTARFRGLPGEEAAFVGGVARLMLGENPAALWNSESARVAERNSRLTDVEIAYTRVESAKADFRRECKSRLTTEELQSVVEVPGRVTGEDRQRSSQPAGSSRMRSGDSSSTHPRRNPIAAVMGSIYEERGIFGVIAVVVLCFKVLSWRSTTPDS